MTAEFFDQRFIPEPFSGCWLWTMYCGKNGYGRCRYHSRDYGAHRLAWEFFRGEIPSGLCVLHKCDTPSCINPDHLFLGTHADNAQDRARKGRSDDRHGSLHPMAKLTEEEIIEIRNDLRSQQEIGKDYGICQAHVSAIKLGQKWKSVRVKETKLVSAPS